MEESPEVWLPIAGHLLGWPYEVSNQGRVRRTGAGDKVRRPAVTPTGYLRVSLRNRGAEKTEFVHRLVAVAFIGEAKPGMQVNHKNGIKADNSHSNLEWLTCSENHMHAVQLGLRERIGVGHFLRRLSMDDAKAVRSLRSRGVEGKFLARWFGVSKQTIYQIANGRSYQN